MTREPFERVSVRYVPKAAEKEERVRFTSAWSKVVPGRIDACPQSGIETVSNGWQKTRQVFEVFATANLNAVETRQHAKLIADCPQIFEPRLQIPEEAP